MYVRKIFTEFWSIFVKRSSSRLGHKHKQNIFIKALRFLDIVSAQQKIKKPLQFRTMYYSYLYEQRLRSI